MASIYILNEDEILHILQFLGVSDRIAFAYTCETFRQVCMDNNAFRKLDLNRCVVRKQQSAIMEIFRDKQMAQHIRELNLNNHHAMNWQKHVELQQLILPKCNHLQALHVLNCGMSLRTIDSILQQASEVTTLSFSVIDISREDIDFLLESPNGICLENIRNLHLETPGFNSYLRISKYLVLSRCKYLEELEIYIWHIQNPSVYEIERNLNSLSFPQSSSPITDTLQYFHSLMIHESCDLVFPSWTGCCLPSLELCDFIFQLVKMKSHATKWKKFWISPPIPSSFLQHMFNTNDSTIPFPKDLLDEVHSVQSLTAHACNDTMPSLDKLTTMFQSIDDNTLKNLYLYAHHYQLDRKTHILELFQSISRTGGHALRFLKLCITSESFLINAQFTAAFNRLFSSCCNITELDLLGCHFEKIICGSLSKLKHLFKVHVPHCAILLQNKDNQLEQANAELLNFMKNCQKITEFDVRGCNYDYCVSDSCGSELQALSNLTKLKSLTLYDIVCIKDGAFLKGILEHCQFLTMLRIMIMQYNVKDSHFIPFTILESANFLKHLAIHVTHLDLGWKDLWKLLSHATKLERLCIMTEYGGSLNIDGAVEMVKSLPQLHVLHLHCRKVQNLEIFHDHILRAMKEDKSDCGYCFEFLTDGCRSSEPNCICKKGNPINIAELCLMEPSLSLPRF